MAKPIHLGASFSTKYCRELDLDPKAVLQAAIEELGIKQFRLMSYWDEIEPEVGKFDFSDLDWQFDMIAKAGGKISLAIGMRQPRWPECHVPNWAKELNKTNRTARLLEYLTEVVKRYQDYPALVSYQLENEALNRGFGACDNFDRGRLRQEFTLVKRLDSKRPVIMTASNSWGLPWRRPVPDIVGFSIYQHQHNRGKATRNRLPASFQKLRAELARSLLGRAVLIHELQAEPWGSKATHKLSFDEQLYLMDDKQLKANVMYAIKSGLKHIDLWGLEWWYYQRVHFQNPKLWSAASELFHGDFKG